MRYFAQLMAFIWFAACAPAAFQPLWATAFGSPVYETGLAVGPDGSACVFSRSSTDFSIVKHSSAGVPQWTNRYDSLLLDYPTGIAIDSVGSVVVCGVSSTNSANGRTVLLKYSANGSLIWGHTNDVTDVLYSTSSLAMDPVDDSVVSLVCSTGILTLKYSAAGIPLWTNFFPVALNAFASVKALKCDFKNNTVVIGEVRTTNAVSLLVVKYSPTGAPIATTVQPFPNTAGFVTAAALDTEGSIYVASSLPLTTLGGYHIATWKFDSSGALVWSRFRPPANGYNALARQIAVDSAGNVIVTGYDTRPIDDEEDESQTLTIKYDANGAELWSARSGINERTPAGLFVNSDDTIVVAGSDAASSGPIVFLLKYQTNGSQLAETTLPDHYFLRIARTSDEELYLTTSLKLGGPELKKFAYLAGPSPISATIQPQFVEALPGSSVTFTAIVSGVGPFSYNWRHFGYMTGGTNATFTITNAQNQSSGPGDYTVAVSNATDYTISPEARLTVLDPPHVSLWPTNYFLTNGQTAVLNALVSGSSLSYFWFFNGRLIAGANTNVLTIPSAQSSNVGFYRLVATNRAGAATSAVAQVTFIFPPMGFTNPTPIEITSNTIAVPYPSEIVVSGVTSRIVKLTAVLRDVTYDGAENLSVLLATPDATGLLLADGSAEESVVPATVTFDDDAPGYLGVFETRSARPAGWPCCVSFPQPAPTTLVRTFSAMAAGNPNGTWRLYVKNNGSGWWVKPGQIARGWQLDFMIADPNGVISTSFSRIQRTGNQISISWDGAPQWKLQRSPSLANPNWTDVPGTIGESSVQLLLSSKAEFFRLIKE